LRAKLLLQEEARMRLEEEEKQRLRELEEQERRQREEALLEEQRRREMLKESARLERQKKVRGFGASLRCVGVGVCLSVSVCLPVSVGLSGKGIVLSVCSSQHLLWGGGMLISQAQAIDLTGQMTAMANFEEFASFNNGGVEGLEGLRLKEVADE
jgi:hypothetical protein